MTETLRVALVNDYEIVSEALRALLRPYDLEILCVEREVKGTPQRVAHVTTRIAKKTRCVNGRGTSSRVFYRLAKLNHPIG